VRRALDRLGWVIRGFGWAALVESGWIIAVVVRFGWVGLGVASFVVAIAMAVLGSAIRGLGLVGLA